jgi:hypothetical protein
MVKQSNQIRSTFTLAYWLKSTYAILLTKERFSKLFLSDHYGLHIIVKRAERILRTVANIPIASALGTNFSPNKYLAEVFTTFGFSSVAWCSQLTSTWPSGDGFQKHPNETYRQDIQHLATSYLYHFSLFCVNFNGFVRLYLKDLPETSTTYISVCCAILQLALSPLAESLDSSAGHQNSPACIK